MAPVRVGRGCELRLMTSSPNPDFHLDHPGALIAAIPAVLGFVPENSLVLVTLDRGELGAVMRVDLSEALIEGIDHMAIAAASNGPDAAIAVIVDDDGAACRMCGDEHALLSEALTEALDQHGVTLWAAHVVDRIAAGGRWHCADGCGRNGLVEDPSATPMAAAAVLDGRRLYQRRSDLQEVIATVDPARTSTLGFVIAAEAATRATGNSDADGRTRADADFVIRAAVTEPPGGPDGPSDAHLARLACALTDPRVRDMAYALAVGSHAAPAEALWATLARVLPDPWRADALALLAFSAYARGDGPLAGIALEVALTSDPAHNMAGMLDEALHKAMRPNQIRELALSGFRVATRLGVALPPRRTFGSRAG